MLGEVRYVKRPHPPGEAGIRTSLREVALGAGAGRNDEDVLRWTRNVVERERIKRGFRADTPRKRAELFLAEVQEKVWTPDPIGTEFMAASRLLACDLATLDKDCFATGDCDDRVRLYGSSTLSVGIPTLIVGHSYRADKKVGHVLTAVFVDSKWEYADPTLYKEPLGSVTPFTHEIVLEPFTGKVVCEGKGCLRNVSGDVEQYLDQGVFVGVSGPPRIKQRLVFLSQEQRDSGTAARDAAYQELKKQDVNRNNAKPVARAVAGAAAGAACAAAGAPVAAPICATIASEFTAGLIETFSSIGRPGSPTDVVGSRAYSLEVLKAKLDPTGKIPLYWGRQQLVSAGMNPQDFKNSPLHPTNNPTLYKKLSDRIKPAYNLAQAKIIGEAAKVRLAGSTTTPTTATTGGGRAAVGVAAVAIGIGLLLWLA